MLHHNLSVILRFLHDYYGYFLYEWLEHLCLQSSFKVKYAGILDLAQYVLQYKKSQAICAISNIHIGTSSGSASRFILQSINSFPTTTTNIAIDRSLTDESHIKTRHVTTTEISSYVIIINSSQIFTLRKVKLKVNNSELDRQVQSKQMWLKGNTN